MSKFPALPFSAEICPLLQENAIKQCSVFFNLWKVEKVTALKIFTWDSKGNWNQIIVCENTLKRHSTEI